MSGWRLETPEFEIIETFVKQLACLAADGSALKVFLGFSLFLVVFAAHRLSFVAVDASPLEHDVTRFLLDLRDSPNSLQPTLKAGLVATACRKRCIDRPSWTCRVLQMVQIKCHAARPT